MNKEGLNTSDMVAPSLEGISRLLSVLCHAFSITKVSSKPTVQARNVFKRYRPSRDDKKYVLKWYSPNLDDTKKEHYKAIEQA
jgi:hypothetical protein